MSKVYTLNDYMNEFMTSKERAIYEKSFTKLEKKYERRKKIKNFLIQRKKGKNMSDKLDNLISKGLPAGFFDSLPQVKMPSPELVNFKNPINETNELLQKHLDMVEEQNQLLRTSLEQSINNYKILKEQYDLQVEINEENKKDIADNKKESRLSRNLAIIGIVVGVVVGAIGWII